MYRLSRPPTPYFRPVKGLFDESSVESGYDDGSIDSDALDNSSVAWRMAPLFPPVGVEVIDLTYDKDEVEFLERTKKQKAALRSARQKISISGYSALVVKKSRKKTIRLYREIERLGCQRHYVHRYNTRSMSYVCLGDVKGAIIG